MPRARDLGVTIGALPPGPLDAITDVPGVRVGHATVIRGRARTGVTAILPHEGSTMREQVPAAIVVLNGAGEITGRSLVDEYGTLESPILLTSPASVGVAHRACVEWLAEREDLGEAEEGTFYWVDLVGLEVVTAAGAPVGKVTGLLETGAVDVLEVRGEKGEVLIPLAPYVEVDLERRRIVVDPPEGLLEED